MIYPFDIFQTETGGSVRWLEAAETLEAAKARVQELALLTPHGSLTQLAMSRTPANGSGPLRPRQ